ncbi:chitinase [Actinopolyspora lacussalsi subsp. righensis]|uniref:chitinase n=1 Tax=Actinopolyspora righensis TaxID=995060 RepID=A0A1I6YC35_9ACTN|nr:glycoside hydrolase family 18 protein [Actinopolyspora righensis]SFT47962.1 chitinase [Actinopolyspora righensis]
MSLSTRSTWRLSALATGAALFTGLLAAPATATGVDGSTEQGADRAATAEAAAQSGSRKVGYFTQWSIYDRQFYINDLVTSGTAEKLTHINYAFGNLDSSGQCFTGNQAGEADAWADYQKRFSAANSVDGVADTWDQPLAGNLHQLAELKEMYPHLKVYISLGGWSWSDDFHTAAATQQSRAQHVKSCIDMWLRGNLPKLGGSPQGGEGVAAGIFDGVDIDWEWPASEGGPGTIVDPADKQNYTALLREWRSQLDGLEAETGETYDLTAFLPASPEKIDAGFEVNKVFDSLDFATVQGYDLHGAYEETTNHQSALYSPAGDPSTERFSVDKAIDTYLARGAPANELVLGVPFYGRGWTGVPDQNNGLFQTSTGPAPATYEAGYEDYKVLKDKVGQYTIHRDEQAGFAWLFDGNTFWTFDDPVEIARKMDYVNGNGLGGAMIWSLDGDTADGELMTAIDENLN